jgi:hypothetical protein
MRNMLPGSGTGEVPNAADNVAAPADCRLNSPPVVENIRSGLMKDAPDSGPIAVRRSYESKASLNVSKMEPAWAPNHATGGPKV